MNGNISTRQGDTGRTGIVGRERVDKDDARIECLGEMDEANGSLGLLRSKLGAIVAPSLSSPGSKYLMTRGRNRSGIRGSTGASREWMPTARSPRGFDSHLRRGLSAKRSGVFGHRRQGNESVIGLLCGD
ncbi:ATP:cob(I)alamin adenosyltransferase [Candidatus Pelagisphaera phototrophica]|uniref:ATP:cob(I)alamin adenosyltransferase n=1 Tax=Candidatus Pelagisphaera phototrophica TaxID=2684113 RepID=UPI0019FA5E3B|nr:ATP:cob(I)alamin adenosyltransferase [Candidatus Pelagisphaera phototrophica]